jgi:hypothetical protein
MRLFRAVLLVALASSVAAADGSKVPLRVVRVLPSTNQALMFDKTRDTHVLAAVGETVDGFTVEDVGDDEVTLTGADGAQVVLAAPDRPWERAPHRAPARPAKPQPPKAEPAPIDPYADPDVRTVEAPAVDAGEGVRVAEAPAAEPAAPPVVDPLPPPIAAAPSAPAPAAVAPAVAPPVAPPTAPTVIVSAPATETAPVAATVAVVAAPDSAPVSLTRAQLRARLADFGALAAAIHAELTPDGVRIEAVGADSLFAQLGLRANDVITDIDSRPVRSLDDAAELYARAATARNITAHVQRAGKPITLRVAIH